MSFDSGTFEIDDAETLAVALSSTTSRYWVEPSNKGQPRIPVLSPCKIAFRAHKSLYPMRRLKFFSVSRKAAAAQRSGISARQRHTRRVLMRTPDCELSIRWVLAKQ